MPRNERGVRSFTSDTWILCNWCREKQGYELYKTVMHDHAHYLPCDHPYADHLNVVFCSERCKNYYLEAPRNNGNLPPGMRTLI